MIMACKQEILEVTLSLEMIHNAVESFAMSKRVTQALIKASILNILYQRMVLNEADLKTREFEGTPIIVFKRKHVKDPLLKQYNSWMKGILDAIDKNYLKDAFMYMKNAINDEIIETYKFSLNYNQDEKEVYKSTPSFVKLAIDKFLVAINDLGKQKKLSDDTEIQIELTYLEETPKRYEPPGFKASIKRHNILAPNCNVRLGTLDTGYHKLTCHGGGEIFKEQPLPVETMEVVEIEDENGNENNLYEQTTVENVSPNIEETKDTLPKVAPHQLNTSDITVSDNFFNPSVISDNGLMTEGELNCLCEMTIPLEAEIIECVMCTKAYHAPCHGYLSKEEACRGDFVCIQCGGKDTKISQVLPSDRMLFCRIRFVLYYLDKRGQLPLDVLNFMPESDHKKVIEKLESFNIIRGKKARKVNPVALRQIIERFFVLDDSQML